jgi:formate dehydrogenase maturation protein FdhE
MNRQSQNEHQEKDQNKDNQKEVNQKQNDVLYCSVKNCARRIEKGKEIRIENNVYCPICGAIVIKSVLGI